VIVRFPRLYFFLAPSPGKFSSLKVFYEVLRQFLFGEARVFLFLPSPSPPGGTSTVVYIRLTVFPCSGSGSEPCHSFRRASRGVHAAISLRPPVPWGEGAVSRAFFFQRRDRAFFCSFKPPPFFSIRFTPDGLFPPGDVEAFFSLGRNFPFATPDLRICYHVHLFSSSSRMFGSSICFSSL